MDQCFLFTHYLDEQGCLCLKLSPDGTVLSPPAQRNFAEIQTLQVDSNTVLVESGARASLLELELPWLSEQKARTAIPYALEEKLAQSVDELHFAFDKIRYKNGHYLITVIEKQRIQFLMHFLDKNNIQFDIITLDWFALSDQQMLISGSSLLINNDDFKGTLSGDLAQSYIRNHPINELLTFTDSTITVDSSLVKNTEDSATWIAKKLAQGKPLNLCQGNMQHGTNSDWIKKGYQLAGALCCFWLISLLIVNIINVYSLNKKTATIDQQISVIYHEFFPDAKQVISPQFRISQLLGNNTTNNQSNFWFLLNQFAKAMKGSDTKIEQLRFQNKTLSVTLVSADFATLEQIENKLKKLQLKVKQTQAATREQHVVATLELM